MPATLDLAKDVVRRVRSSTALRTAKTPSPISLRRPTSCRAAITVAGCRGLRFYLSR